MGGAAAPRVGRKRPFQGQLTAFGEMLAGHPFATDRPGATHEMAVEYARALDAYERATREAVRDPALARRELDDGLAALNRLNVLLVGALPGDPPPPPKDARLDKPPPAGTPRPPVAAVGRTKPGLRDRYTREQLLLRAGLSGLACYITLVGVLGSWQYAVFCLVGTNFGVGLAAGGGVFTGWPVAQLRGALKGGRVVAEYTGTKRSGSGGTSWQQHYVHVRPDGGALTYRRDVPSESRAPLPTRRLWLVAGAKPEMFLTPLALLLGVPLLLGGTALTLAAVPGTLILALAHHHG
ncbi:hypothetical protein [Streptantibioticus cattleyicolor]|uniref:Uncharacterized protein n=1 Tax=Streptantibioticus cattleyicolor (strain ATCC 35852 / DSM 46488 / JCM 4925 / NBRC 14057 / NRRL 8057) TaxID=1003195 RepID=F8JLM9_STREN|nr:hypothetical protein [Streptantibioticus cattleyicolor]AEW99544.1 hypothetical protein SCATT_p13510 [Streptantibioticus cattleyicolor NRRL 8057 = DSM 46488]CCB71419.1 membrane protein of unknown function [Streptantibioticus cattleyicolor NRRL 8057 = DSM 46488]